MPIHSVHCILWASLLVELVKNPPAMQETPVQFLDQEYPLEKRGCTLQDSWVSLVDQSTICLQCWGWGGGDLGSIPVLWRSHGGNPLLYSCLEKPQEQRSLAGCRPWHHKEWDVTEWLSTALYINHYIFMIAWSLWINFFIIIKYFLIFDMHLVWKSILAY